VEGLFAVVVGLGVLIVGPRLQRAVNRAFAEAFGLERQVQWFVPVQVVLTYAVGVLLIVAGIGAALVDAWNWLVS
jgi:hypothetical protein